jgi:hypothetical protein
VVQVGESTALMEHIKEPGQVDSDTVVTEVDDVPGSDGLPVDGYEHGVEHTRLQDAVRPRLGEPLRKGTLELLGTRSRQLPGLDEPGEGPAHAEDLILRNHGMRGLLVRVHARMEATRDRDLGQPAVSAADKVDSSGLSLDSYSDAILSSFSTDWRWWTGGRGFSGRSVCIRSDFFLTSPFRLHYRTSKKMIPS